jgi:hypothetical protein
MNIDKELYRKAYTEYRQWNKLALAKRIHEASLHTPQERWREYLDLWNFCRKLGVKASPYQRQQKLEALELYYARVQKMETWRRERG